MGFDSNATIVNSQPGDEIRDECFHEVAPQIRGRSRLPSTACCLFLPGTWPRLRGLRLGFNALWRWVFSAGVWGDENEVH